MKLRLLSLLIMIALNLPAHGQMDMQTYRAKQYAAAQQQWTIDDETWRTQVQEWPRHLKEDEIEDLCIQVKLDQQAYWADIESVGTDLAAYRKRKLENGLRRLWIRGIPMAMRLQRRPCTPEQKDWLDRFVQCARLAASKNADYNTLCVSLATRPPEPAEPGPEPARPTPPANASPEATAPAAGPVPPLTRFETSITKAAPLEAYGPDGSMTGVSPATVGQHYTCLRIENGKALLQDTQGNTFRIQADAIRLPVNSTQSAAGGPAPTASTTTPAHQDAPSPDGPGVTCFCSSTEIRPELGKFFSVAF